MLLANNAACVGTGRFFVTSKAALDEMTRVLVIRRAAPESIVRDVPPAANATAVVIVLVLVASNAA